MRCLLFIPADSERKLDKARSIDVDGLILDLEDAVAADRRDVARDMAADALAGLDNAWVRINPWQTEDAEKDLAAIMPRTPAGIVLPKPASVDDVRALSARLDELEQAHGIAAGSTRIISLCTERVSALFSLGDYRGASKRLAALSWGAEDLAAELGATANRDAEGRWLPPYEMARSLCLFAAHAAEVAALDTVYTDFRDADGLRDYARRAARDGFSGMLAIHPAQVDIIQQTFTPSPQDVDHARRVVALFDDNPGAGVLSMDGRMLDRPHYINARRVLERVADKGESS